MSETKCDICGSVLTPAQVLHQADDGFDVCSQQCYNAVMGGRYND